MTEDTVRIPPHLQIVGKVWAEFAEGLDRRIEPVMPIVTDCIAREHGVLCRELVKQETDALLCWTQRLTTWMHGQLTTALTNPRIDDWDMCRVAGRVAHFADELIERREGLRALSRELAMRAAAPRLDAVYVALLQQVQGFVERVVAALGASALNHPCGTKRGDSIELSFTFRPVIDDEMTQLRTWMDSSRARWDVMPPVAERSNRRAATSFDEFLDQCGPLEQAAAPPAGRMWDVWIGVLVVAGLLVPIVLWGFAAIVAIFVIAVVIWCIRNPLIALIGLLVIGGCGWN